MTVLLVAMPTPPPSHSTPAPVSAMLLVNHMLHKVQDHVSAFFFVATCHLWHKLLWQLITDLKTFSM